VNFHQGGSVGMMGGRCNHQMEDGVHNLNTQLPSHLMELKFLLLKRFAFLVLITLRRAWGKGAIFLSFSSANALKTVSPSTETKFLISSIN